MPPPQLLAIFRMAIPSSSPRGKDRQASRHEKIYIDMVAVHAEFLHVKPGKGAAFVRTKLKNYITGNVVDKTFRAGESATQAVLEKRDCQYTYSDGDEVSPYLCVTLMRALQIAPMSKELWRLYQERSWYQEP